MEPTALHIDFTSGPVAHRLRYGGGRGQALARAVGLRRGACPHVVDATAGLGRDAILLAALGARVTMIERSARVHGLLRAALDQARDGALAEVVARMELYHGDARTLLPRLCPEVVLVDPMHPPRGNSALVKQEMRQLRAIVGEDDDSPALIRSALASARQRVVLKWPRKAPLPPGLPKPSHQIVGKSTRYDVWMRPPPDPAGNG